MKINHTHAPTHRNIEEKKAKEQDVDLEGTEPAAEVHLDFAEYDNASATDVFAAAAANHGRKRTTYIPPAIKAGETASQAANSRSEGQLKNTLEKIAKRLSELPPPKPLTHRG